MAGVREEKKYEKCSELHHLLDREAPPVCTVALALPSLHVLVQMNNLQEQQAVWQYKDDCSISPYKEQGCLLIFQLDNGAGFISKQWY